MAKKHLLYAFVVLVVLFFASYLIWRVIILPSVAEDNPYYESIIDKAESTLNADLCDEIPLMKWDRIPTGGYFDFGGPIYRHYRSECKNKVSSSFRDFAKRAIEDNNPSSCLEVSENREVRHKCLDRVKHNNIDPSVCEYYDLYDGSRERYPKNSCTVYSGEFSCRTLFAINGLDKKDFCEEYEGELKECCYSSYVRMLPTYFKYPESRQRTIEEGRFVLTDYGEDTYMLFRWNGYEKEVLQPKKEYTLLNICEIISTNECYSSMAIVLGDPNICDNLNYSEENKRYVESCKINAISRPEHISVCEDLEDDNDIYRCYYMLVRLTRDPSYCDNIVSNHSFYTREDCYEDACWDHRICEEQENIIVVKEIKG